MSEEGIRGNTSPENPGERPFQQSQFFGQEGTELTSEPVDVPGNEDNVEGYAKNKSSANPRTSSPEIEIDNPDPDEIIRIGVGTGTTGNADSLYFLSGRNNLRYILAQGYIGPIFNRKSSTNDYLDRAPGSVPLFSAPLGADLIDAVSIGTDGFPFALEISTANIPSSTGAWGLTSDGKHVEWDKDQPGVIALTIPGSIPISAFARVITRSESEKADLQGFRSGDKNVRFDSLEFVVDASMFSEEEAGADRINLWFDSVPSLNSNELVELVHLDNTLNRLTGGLVESLHLLSSNFIDSSPLKGMRSWLEDTLSNTIVSDASFSRVVQGFVESRGRLFHQDRMPDADRWLFENICLILTSAPVDTKPNRTEIHESLIARLADAQLKDYERADILIILEKIKRYVRPRGPLFQGFDEDSRSLQSSKPLLLAILAQNRQGLESYMSTQSIEAIDLLQTALFLGMMEGRRDTHCEFRNENLDRIYSDWISEQLTLKPLVNRDAETSKSVSVSLVESPVDLAEVVTQIEIDGQVVFRRRFEVPLPSLAELFADRELQASDPQTAALHVCEQMGWVDECIETKIKYDLSRMKLHTQRGDGDKSEMVIAGVAELIKSVNGMVFTEKLHDSELIAPDGLIRDVHAILNGSLPPG